MNGIPDTLNTSDLVIQKLEVAGFRAALIPFSCIKQIMAIYDAYVENSGNLPFSLKENFFSNQPPNIAFEPMSFLVIAFQSSEGEIRLRRHGKELSLPIPPTYLDDSIMQRMDEVLRQAVDGWQLVRVKGISLKLLAVMSGLGKYGRNNLCYVDGIGSHCNFCAYYTDVPCVGSALEPTMMDDCGSCRLCVGSCPTGALGGTLPIEISRCLTMLNEFDAPMPDWLSPNVHHTVVGCLRCQEVCPVNITAKKSKKEPLELSGEETCLLLEQISETLPSGLVEKIADYGIWRDFISLAGRNIALAIQAGQGETNNANR